MNNSKRKQNTAAATPGFAIPIFRDTDLGIATLIVEDEEGHYEPVNYASSLGEGFEMAKEDLRSRERRLENFTLEIIDALNAKTTTGACTITVNDDDPGLRPFEYKLWAR